ncbi:MAG: glycoside hydrolase family 99-like domain-containing protein [Bacteroides cellulosilyticus]
MAQEAGIGGFAIIIIGLVMVSKIGTSFNEVLRFGKPNFSFCLCWANEAWHSKFWNKDGSIQKKCLIEQKYDTEEGHIKHFPRLCFPLLKTIVTSVLTENLFL